MVKEPKALLGKSALALGSTGDMVEWVHTGSRRNSTMSDTATQLLAAFESLSATEQHELLIAMLKRSSELPHAILTDDQLVGIADELFQSLDAEESYGNDAVAR